MCLLFILQLLVSFTLLFSFQFFFYKRLLVKHNEKTPMKTIHKYFCKRQKHKVLQRSPALNMEFGMEKNEQAKVTCSIHHHCETIDILTFAELRTESPGIKYILYQCKNYKHFKRVVDKRIMLDNCAQKKFWKFAFKVYVDEHEIPIFYHKDSETHQILQRCKYVPQYIEDILKSRHQFVFNDLVDKFMSYKEIFIKLGKY
jgi:hypothetical protein